MPAHANGYACIHSFHLFLLVYIYAELNLFTAPYSSASSLVIYVTPAYKPIVVWLLSSVYEIMSMVLEKNCRNKILFGFTSNKWWRSILRGFLLSLGMWSFYLGLGVGALVYHIIWRATDNDIIFYLKRLIINYLRYRLETDWLKIGIIDMIIKIII